MNRSDEEFLLALETGALPNQQFRHRDHLRAAWLYVEQRGPVDATAAMLNTIRTFAAHHGHSVKFHTTMTIAWVKLVAFHARCHPNRAFTDFLEINRALLDKDLLLRFYTPTRLFSEEARLQWVEPDVRLLPA